ncbi:MAG: STAS domain-containing protein [Acidothermaceae bacterium]
MTHDTQPPADRLREAARSAAFRLAVDQDLGIVQTCGDLDMSVEAAFEEHLRLAFSRRPFVIVDASGVTFADCSALGILAAVGAEMTTRGRRWCVVASPALQRLIDLTKLPIPTASSIESARTLGIPPQ